MSDSAGSKDLPSKTGASSGDDGATGLAVPASSGDATAVTPTASGAIGEGTTDKSTRAASTKGPSLDQLATSLRHAYESTLEEDIPDSIMDLLRKLD